MSNITVKNYFNQDAIKTKFDELLGAKSENFVNNVLQAVSQNSALMNCEPESIYQAAATAAVLDMPINSNLGEAYILPYGKKAQFQIGYKGFIQLAIRSGQYKTIGATPIYDGQIVQNNPLTGYIFDFSKPKEGKPIGFAASFTLKNGFDKTFFMTYAEVVTHAKKYSKTFNKKNSWGKLFDSPWNNAEGFEAMAIKTVLKKLISQFGPKSLQMQTAVSADQSVVNDFENEKFEYPDNEKPKSNENDLNKQFETAEVVEPIIEAEDKDDEIM
tara:strand:+ start:2336 stop:3151 length:816 start_codon:yes stop_codon:yes gene_type:complete